MRSNPKPVGAKHAILASPLLVMKVKAGMAKGKTALEIYNGIYEQFFAPHGRKRMTDESAMQLIYKVIREPGVATREERDRWVNLTKIAAGKKSATTRKERGNPLLPKRKVTEIETDESIEQLEESDPRRSFILEAAYLDEQAPDGNGTELIEYVAARWNESNPDNPMTANEVAETLDEVTLSND